MRWPLPACVNGSGLVTDSTTRRRLFVQIFVGYGLGACGRHLSTQILGIVGSREHRLLFLPGENYSVRLAG